MCAHGHALMDLYRSSKLIRLTGSKAHTLPVGEITIKNCVDNCLNTINFVLPLSTFDQKQITIIIMAVH